MNRDISKKEQHAIGRQIRAPKVLCIDNQNTNHGVISIQEALEIADKCGLDLVQVVPGDSNKPPTCKVLDYSKFKYELIKREKVAKKKQRENSIKIKEIKFRPVTAKNDLAIKAKQAQSFINDGDRVKITVVLKGRELSHQDVAIQTINDFISMISGIELINKIESSGRQICAMIGKASAEKVA